MSNVRLHRERSAGLDFGKLTHCAGLSTGTPWTFISSLHLSGSSDECQQRIGHACRIRHSRFFLRSTSHFSAPVGSGSGDLVPPANSTIWVGVNPSTGAVVRMMSRSPGGAGCRSRKSRPYSGTKPGWSGPGDLSPASTSPARCGTGTRSGGHTHRGCPVFFCSGVWRPWWLPFTRRSDPDRPIPGIGPRPAVPVLEEWWTPSGSTPGAVP